MRVCLIGEGTYPVVRGGVSTWSDQVVRGLPDVDFHVAVLTAGRAQAVYDLPANVRKVAALDMWGPIPTRKPTTRQQLGAFEDAWEVICGHAYGRGGRTSAVTLEAWQVLTRRDIAERLWWLLNDQRSLALLHSIRLRAGLRPSTGRDLANSMAYVARMIMPCSLPPVDADVVHVTSLGSALLAALPSYSEGIPILLSEHGVFFRERLVALRAADWSFLQRNMVAAFLKSMTRVGYAAAASIAPVSDFNGRWARALGAEPERVQTIHNGVDLGSFRFSDEEPDTPTIVFVGRIDPLKDLLTLVRAIPEVVDHVPDVKVRIVGPIPETNGDYAIELRKAIEGLGLSDVVQFAGPTTDPAAAYATGTIAVLSSISEGFPYGAIEPMACGRPLVATNVGGIPEGVGDAGILVRSRNPHELAQGCIRLLTNPELRRTLGEQGRQRVEEHFTLERMIGRIGQRYEEVAATVPARASAGKVAEPRGTTVDVADRVLPYLHPDRDSEWAYSLIRSKAQG